MRSAGTIACLILVSFVTQVGAAQDERATEIASRIRRRPLESKALAAAGYSKKIHAFEVEFRNGAVYRYYDVPASLYRDFLGAESKAQFYRTQIRGHFHSVHVRRALQDE